ncbi:MAG: class I SAM-dependent methyltransferase [Dichotomicrobium sp.]
MSDDLDGLGDAYADWRASTLGRITDALEQGLVLDLIGPPDGRRILDVGCGDGVLATMLARRGAQVFGVDASPRMIAAARRRGRVEGAKARFAVARAERLPFASECFDSVVAVTVLCFIADPAAALAEMARVLKPGGRLILGELNSRSTWAAVRRIKGWLGSPVWRAAHFRSPGELRRLAIAAGLSDVAVRGAIFYPPKGAAARLLAPTDRLLGRVTTLGAAFLALSAEKSAQGGGATGDDGQKFRRVSR